MKKIDLAALQTVSGGGHAAPTQTSGSSSSSTATINNYGSSKSS